MCDAFAKGLPFAIALMGYQDFSCITHNFVVAFRQRAILRTSVMTDTLIKSHIRPPLFKDLLLDLEDRLRAEALAAHEMIRDHSGLNRKRAREAEGQARFRMMEQGFEEVCKLHGGHLLEGGLIPNTELPVFQPFMRFEAEGKGIILGLASMPEPKALPTKNKSRLAGITLNYDLIPRLDFDGKEPKIGDIFVLLLASRDREKPGKIEEIAVGVIDSKYESFLFYEPLDKFLSAESGVPAVAPEPPSPASVSAPVVSLKPRATPFIPPEAPAAEDDSAKSE